MKKLSQSVFIIVFSALAYSALHIPLTYLFGAQTKLTAFDSFAPIAGGLFSLPITVATLFIIQGINLTSITVVSIVKIITPLVAAFYFSKQHRFQLAIPLVAIIAFNVHPTGRSVWYYSLFWTIPILCYVIKDKSLVAKALGATFSAHAVGGMVWVYVIPLTPAVWSSLIPLVAAERLCIALGSAIFYVALKNIQKEIQSLIIARRHTIPITQEGKPYEIF